MSKAPTSRTLAEMASIPADFLPMQLEVSESLPDVRDIPVRVQQMFALLAMGWSLSATAKAFRISKQALVQNQNRYDPDRRFSLSKDAKRNFIIALAEARISEALVHITPQKLKDASAVDLASIAKRLANILETAPKKPDEKPPVQVLLARLIGEAVVSPAESA